MNVTIQGVTVAYYPDYSPTSQLWKVHLRDAFRMVTLAGTECFVKRFVSKPRAWSFMVDCKGKRQTGLPTIYEAKSATEDGKRVYYLILEKIEGDTLHDLMKSKVGGKASVGLMGRTIASAFRTVHAQGYWHADFCAKNIMVATGGRRFVVIDLDSLEPVATRPTQAPNEPGYLPDQELAIYALTYLQSYIESATKGFGVIPGPALNLLQLVFLLDKLIYYSEVLKSKGIKFRDLAAFHELPHIVHRKLGVYTDHLVKRILAQTADSEMVITQPSFFQKELLPPGQVKTSTATASPLRPRPAALASAVLIYFQASRYSVLPAQTTMLIWKVEGVLSVEITNLGTQPPEGSCVIAHSPSLVGEQAYILTAAGGIVRETVKVEFFIPTPLISPSLPIPPKPSSSSASIISFFASSYFVFAGQQTVISWKVIGPSSVHISHIGTVPASGAKSFESNDLYGRVEFAVTAGSPPVKKSFFVEFPARFAASNALPSKGLSPIALVNFSSTAQNVMAGQAVELSWEVSGAASVHITQLGTLPAKGRHTIQHSSAIVGEQLYTLTVAGTAIKKDITVRFIRSSRSAVPPQVTKNAPSARSTPQPRAVTINSFTADSYSLIGGGQTEISWDVSGAPFAHISNIGIVSSKGFKTFNSKAFKGKVEFVLTAGIPAVKRSFFVDFPAAPALSVVHAAPVVPAVPVTSANLYPSQYLAQAATNPPTAKAPVPVAKSGKGMWLAILSIIFLIVGGWAYRGTAFTPNQGRGLQQFDREEYDSSFANLIKFRDDTSHKFATQYNLAYMYDKGKGTVVDDGLAVQLYKQCLRSAVPAVVSKSLYSLGLCSLQGEGCFRDTAKAREYLALAAVIHDNPNAVTLLESLSKGDAHLQSVAAPSHLPLSLRGESFVPSTTSVATNPTPPVGSFTPTATFSSINRVEQLGNCTRVDFTYTNPSETVLFLPGPSDQDATYIEWAGLRFASLLITGIGDRQRPSYYYPGKPTYFSVYFEKIPKGATEINITDGNGIWAFSRIKLGPSAVNK